MLFIAINGDVVKFIHQPAVAATAAEAEVV